MIRVVPAGLCKLLFQLISSSDSLISASPFSLSVYYFISHKCVFSCCAHHTPVSSLHRLRSVHMALHTSGQMCLWALRFYVTSYDPDWMATESPRLSASRKHNLEAQCLGQVSALGISLESTCWVLGQISSLFDQVCRRPSWLLCQSVCSSETQRMSVSNRCSSLPPRRCFLPHCLLL